jgi:hypothetical protein
MMRSILCLATLVLLGACASSPQRRESREGFISLFDGKSLSGWRANENPDSFKVRDGLIVVHGPRSHLFYEGPVNGAKFRNFHLKLQAMTEPNSNSGVYFHTEFQPSGWPARGFEAQVNNTHSDPKKTGGLYAIRDVMNVSPARDHEWFDYDILVQDKHVVLKVNGQVTAEWTQPDDWKPPANMPGRSLGSGTFALQGHDPVSVVYYRNIRVKPLP